MRATMTLAPGFPFNALAKCERAESALSVPTMENALFAFRLVFVLLPRTSEMAEAAFGITHADTESVVAYFNGVNAVERIADEADVDLRGVGVHAVPDQFGEGKDWLLRLSQTVNMVLGDFYGQGLHADVS
jgi:hypothetical protein